MRCFALAVLLLAACGGGAPKHPNVLLVTIDTLRPDAVGEGTPALHAFFGQASHFTHARTVTPLTLPAHASIFTGLFPTHHGIHDNVSAPLPPAGQRDFPLLAEQFRHAGYSTAAFVARAVLAPSTGISSGFEVYDCPTGDAERDDTGGYIPGDERVKAPIAWLEAPPEGKPWFVWVHLFDPHAPYRPYAGDGVRAPSSESDTTEGRYHGDVRRADAAFEQLLRAVGADTIVILCSDHGEGLMEHEEATHGPLCYSTTLDVVLAARGPGFKPGVSPGLRSVADVAPTLRRACGLPELPADGTDLAGAPHETLVSESLLAFTVHGWGQCFAATDGQFTLVEAGPRLELFDRRGDAAERTPLPLSHPAYEKLDRAMERFRTGPAASYEGEMLASVSPYGEARRRDLRYLPRYENARLIDPRIHVKSWLYLVSAIRQLVLMGETQRDAVPLRQALRLLAELETAASPSPWIDRNRAVTYAMLARVTGDRANLAEALRCELASIEKGYVQRDSIRAALSYIADTSDADALRTLVRLLKPHTLDPESVDALQSARRALNVTE